MENLASPRLRLVIQPENKFRPYNERSHRELLERTQQAKRDFGFVPRKPIVIRDGQILPKNFEPVPKEIFGRPIEDLDGISCEKTFCIISKRFSKHYVNRFSSTPAFFVFTPWNPIRKAALFVSTNEYFDYLVIFTILVNCVFLALSTPVEQAEYVFMSVYTGEMIIKAVSKGFIINKYTYLRNAWNCLDFIVITLGFITYFVDLGNLSGLRTFRVLRALKTLYILPGLKTIVNALLHSVSMLTDVMALTTFCLSVFALFGLQIFMGILRNKCVLDGFEESLNDSQYRTYVTSESNWHRDDGTIRVCGNGSITWGCPLNYTCLPDVGDNPNFGYTSFDNFGWAMLTTFQLLTLDAWEDIYNKIIAAAGPFSSLFFVFVVFLGSFYLINLMLAVVAMSYEEEATTTKAEATPEKKKGKKKKKRKARRMVVTRRGAVMVGPRESEDEEEPEGEEIQPKPGNVPNCKHQVNCNHLDSGVSVGSRRASLRITDSNNAQDQIVTEEPNKEKVKVYTSAELSMTTGNPHTVVKITDSNDLSISLPPPKTTKIAQFEYPDRNCKCCRRSDSCCYYSWLQFQYTVYEFVRDPFFELFITLCIILNTACLAIEHHGMSPTLKYLLNIGNKVFTVIFTMEALLKLIAMSKQYFKTGWNIFDLIAVGGSLIDLSLENFNGLSVLRALRLLRVFKLAQSWTTMKILLSIILSTLGALGNLILVLLIVMYTFAILGMQLFGVNYKPENFHPDPVPRWNFKDFVHSFLMIFRVLCGEWIEPLWDCMRANGSAGQACIALFLPALIVGNFLVLNLFLALLLSSFNSDQFSKTNKKDDDVSRLGKGLRRIKRLILCRRCRGSVNPEDSETTGTISSSSRDSSTNDFSKQSSNSRDSGSNDTLRSNGQTTTLPMDNKGVKSTDVWSNMISQMKTSNPDRIASKASMDSLRSLQSDYYSAQDKTESNEQGASPSEKPKFGRTLSVQSGFSKESAAVDVAVVAVVSTPEAAQEMPEKKNKEPEDCFPTGIYQQWSCCKPFFSSWFVHCTMPIRKAALAIVDHPAFEWIILLLILASSVSLCFEDIYLDERETLKAILDYTNFIFTILFTMEMCLKWLAHGFVVYFTNLWTVLDFVIVLVSTVSLVLESSTNLTALRSMRTLRALRPLRAISRWQGMKIVVNALVSSIPSIVNVLLVCIVFWLIFSIMGVQFFAGKFYKCVDSEGKRSPISKVSNRQDCQNKNLTWENSKVNFDNVGQGYLALFQVATFEGWLEIMADAADSRGVDLQPEYEANMMAYLYFIIFIVCGSFFTLNLFIGVIIDNFNMLKKKYEGGVIDMFLTDSQKNYYAAMKKLGRKKPQRLIHRPKNAYQAKFYDLCMSRRFEMVVFAVIVVNMLSMALEHYHQSHEMEVVLENLNIVFTALFSIEAIIKMIGLRLYYFTVPWNIFDFVLVISSVLGIVLRDFMSNFFVSPTLLRVIRVFRIGRVLRLIKAAKGIRKLLFALVVSLPALFNIGALLFLVMFIYAIIGMSLFGYVKHEGVINGQVNFQTFGNSIMLLFRLITSAGWSDVMSPMMVSPPDCDPHLRALPNGDCGNPMAAILFFVSYVIINCMIIINMYIAVILENFNQAHQEEELGIVEEDIEMFYIRWAKYDPLATQFINYDQLSDFLDSLDPPLRVPKPNSVALVSFNLPIAKGDKVHCLDILHSLISHVLGHVDESDDFHKLREQMGEKFKKQFPTRKELDIESSTMLRKREDMAARVLQKMFRARYKRRTECQDQFLRTPNRFSKLRSSFRMSGAKQSPSIGSFRNVTISRPESSLSRRASSSSGGSVFYVPVIAKTDESSDAKQ